MNLASTAEPPVFVCAGQKLLRLAAEKGLEAPDVSRGVSAEKQHPPRNGRVAAAKQKPANDFFAGRDFFCLREQDAKTQTFRLKSDDGAFGKLAHRNGYRF